MLNTQDMTVEELRAHIARLEGERPSGGIKIGAKGGVSVYGLGRFPVTLFASQWDALIGRIPEVKAFIEANRDKLAVKPAKGQE